MAKFLSKIERLVKESNDEWFERRCYILLKALVTKAKSSQHFKEIELLDSLHVEDGRYITPSYSGRMDTILLKYKGKCVFIYDAPWGPHIFTNGDEIGVNETFNHYCKVNSSGHYTLLKTSIVFCGNPFQKVTLFTEPVFKPTHRHKDKLGDFFSEVLGRPLTHLEKGMVDVIKVGMSNPK